MKYLAEGSFSARNKGLGLDRPGRWAACCWKPVGENHVRWLCGRERSRLARRQAPLRREREFCFAADDRRARGSRSTDGHRRLVLVLAVSPGSVLVVGVVLLVLARQPFRFLDVGPLLLLRETSPRQAELLADHCVAHARIALQNLASLLPAPHHKTVHRPLNVALSRRRHGGNRLGSLLAGLLIRTGCLGYARLLKCSRVGLFCFSSFSISLSPRWKGSSGSARRTIGSDRHSNVCCMPKKRPSQESRNVIAKPSRASRGARLNGQSALPEMIVAPNNGARFCEWQFARQRSIRTPKRRQRTGAMNYCVCLQFTFNYTAPLQIAHPRGWFRCKNSSSQYLLCRASHEARKHASLNVLI